MVGRLISAVVVILAGLFNVPASAAPAPHEPLETLHIYAYDGHCIAAVSTDLTTDRGPPVTTYDPTAATAFDDQSHDASTRHSRLSTHAIYDCDATAPLALIDSATAGTAGQAEAIDADLLSPQRSQVAAKTATGAESALSGALLSNHLRQLEKYGQGGFRELESGRYRYYGNLTPAAKRGEMAGRRLVREWDPGTGATRTWHETIDRSGNIRIVRPETGGPRTHYSFDEFGNFGGAW